MKITLLSLLLLASVSIEAQNLPQTFNLADAPRYSEKTGYGYDRVDTPKKDATKSQLMQSKVITVSNVSQPKDCCLPISKVFK